MAAVHAFPYAPVIITGAAEFIGCAQRARMHNPESSRHTGRWGQPQHWATRAAQSQPGALTLAVLCRLSSFCVIR